MDIPEVETFHATYFPFLEEYLVGSGHRDTESNRLFRKLASSATHLKGGTLVSCETFTWLNEHFNTPLYQCKPEIDNLFTEGINHLFFHGTAYSPESAEWPGWLFYASVHMEPNNPQWEDVSAMNQYITRCQSILQMGEHTNDLLVYWSPDEYYHQAEGLELGLSLHNAESWIRMPGMDSLYAKGYQFDFISDRIIAESEVREGRIFTYGKVPYEAIILPPVRRIKLTTFKKLLQLARDGGRIVFSSMPELVSGFLDYDRQEEELASLVAALEFKEYQGFKRTSLGKGAIFQGDVPQVLDYLGIVRESLSDFHLKSISRKTRNGSYYFVVNHHKTRIDEWVEFKHGGRYALFMDPMNGKLSLAESTFQGNRGKVHVVLEPGASTILHFTDNEIRGVDPNPYYLEMDKQELSGPWAIKAIRGYPVLPPDTLLAKPVFWTGISGDPFKRFAGTCEYSTSFSLNRVSGDNYLLRFERVEASARVSVNGQDAGVLWSFPFEVQVGPLLKEGKNELRIQVSNLGANAIRDLDRRRVNWKKFHDINFVNLDYKPFDASQWDLLPSGLNGKVELVLLESGVARKLP